jgi:serine/threonine protein kinase
MSAEDRVRVGDTLGSYELLSRVGQGGMATVWAARRLGARGFSKIVALKTMLAALGDDVDLQRMFLSEARIAARIRHPNVVETLDLGEHDGALYLVMEWVDGETLAAVMKSACQRGGVPRRIALAIIAAACTGVHAAHELRDEDDRPLGIVHRDVTPPNLLISYGGVVKLADFGVAKSMEANQDLTIAGQVKGKLRYMAPEQLRGASVDRRTDIFALGINLYQLTTGRHPWPGDTAVATMERVLSEDAAPPSTFVEGYPLELERIVLKALARDPTERFATAAEMALAIELFAADSGGLASTGEVAAYLQELLGVRGAKRRETLRKALQDIDGQLRRIDESWDDEPAPAPEAAVPEPSRLLSNRWQRLASLSRSSRTRRTVTLVTTLLLMTTAYALGARREQAIAAAAPVSAEPAPKASPTSPMLEVTPTVPSATHASPGPSVNGARKDRAVKRAPPPHEHLHDTAPEPPVAAKSDPDVGF